MAYITFSTPFGFRLYDREKNRVAPLQQEEYHALQNIAGGIGMEIDYIYLNKLQRKGFCNRSDLVSIEHPATDEIESIVSTHINQMVLQVTQNCNLRCAYCAYSGSYYNRKHSNKHMSIDIALKAINFLMSHSTNVDEVAISFYGGEPILEFELIKRVVSYIEQTYPEKKVRYNITSNLTLFNDEVIKYVIEKNIFIMISIDGPKETQDKYRVFLNGKGSYSTVKLNAERMKAQNPTYFQKCHTNTVISPDGDYRKIKDFLDTDELFGPLYSSVTLVSSDDLKEPISYGDDYYRLVRKEKFKLLLAMLGLVKFDAISAIVKSDSAEIMKMYRLLKSGGIQGITKHHPGGPCIPGEKRVFVDADGHIYPCEKISENEPFQIGNLENGFDIQRIKEMINVGKYTEKECLNCWAFLYCGTCVAKMVDKGDVSREKRLEHCEHVRNSLIGKLQDLEMLQHYGCDFKRMEEM